MNEYIQGEAIRKRSGRTEYGEYAARMNTKKWCKQEREIDPLCSPNQKTKKSMFRGEDKIFGNDRCIANPPILYRIPGLRHSEAGRLMQGPFLLGGRRLRRFSSSRLGFKPWSTKRVADEVVLHR